LRLSVVIPCYNERATIEAVVDAVRSAPVKDVEMIVMDDGSTDGTRELLKAKPHGWVDKIVLQERNSGKGAALRAGFQAATGDLVIVGTFLTNLRACANRMPLLIVQHRLLDIQTCRIMPAAPCANAFAR